MFFLNPLFLLGTFALAGPLIYHFLLRSKPRRIILPTLRFLPMRSAESMAMHRFKNIFLLLLRLLILLLIVGAFARPALRRAQDAPTMQTANEGAVLALDTSLSMRVGHRWDAAQTRANTLLKTFPPRSRLALVAFDRTPRALCGDTDDPAALTLALKGCRPGYAGTDLLAAIRTAGEAAARMDAKRKKVYLISDFQDSGFRQIAQALDLPKGVELVPIRIDDKSPANVAVVSATEVTDAQAQARKRRVRVLARQYGPGKTSGEIRLLDGAKVLATRPVKLADDSQVAADFDLDLPSERDLALTAALQAGDTLKEDNALAFILKARRPLPVLVATQSGQILMGNGDSATSAPLGANPYLKAAILACGRKIAPQWTEPLRIGILSPAQFPVALVLWGKNTAPAVQDAVAQYVQTGGNAIIFPEQGGETTALAKLSGLQESTWEDLGSGTGKYRVVSSVAGQGPASLLGATGGALLGNPKAYRYLKIKMNPAGEARALALFDDGSPFLIERKAGQGRVCLFTIPLDPKASDFVLRATFSPFLYQLLTHCAKESERRSDFVVGEMFQSGPALGKAGRTLTGPDGQTINLSAKGHLLDRPGIYKLAGSGTEEPVAVRIDEEESDLNLMDAARISLFAQTGQREVGPDGKAITPVSSRRKLVEADGSMRLWWYFLTAALGIMALEMLVASRTVR